MNKRRNRVFFFVTSNFQIGYARRIYFDRFDAYDAHLIGRFGLDFSIFMEARAHPFSSFSAISLGRRMVRDAGEDDVFFVPHVHTYLCSYIAKAVSAAQLNLHYEGFSSLINEKLSAIEVLKFSLVSRVLFLGSALENGSIMPRENSFSKLYTPILSEVYNKDKQELLPFDVGHHSAKNNIVLIVGEVFSSLTDDAIADMYSRVVNNYPNSNLYFKPHPRDSRCYINIFGGKATVVKDDLPVEEFVGTLGVSEVAGFVSSSLLNMKAKYPSLVVKFFSSEALYSDSFFCSKANFLKKRGFFEVELDV